MPENRETGEKWSFARSAQRLLLLTLTCRSAIILTNRVTQTIMIDSLSNGVHKSTHRSTVDPSWPNPCRQRSDLDGRVTSQLLRPDILITNCYEITSARTPRVNRKLEPTSHIQELCSHSICSKWTKSDHQHHRMLLHLQQQHLHAYQLCLL